MTCPTAYRAEKLLDEHVELEQIVQPAAIDQNIPSYDRF